MAEIRTAEKEDLEALASVFVRCFSGPPWNEPWTHEAAQRRLQLMLRAPSARALVAIEQDAVVGMALGQVEGWLEGNLFLVQELCVHPAQRNNGIGQTLLASLCARVGEEDDVKAVYLLTDAGSPAEAFYEKCGFGTSEAKVVLGAGAEHLVKQLA